MVTEFEPLFIYVLVAILAAVGMLILSAVINPGRGRSTAVKQMPYESGMDPVGDARQRFDVRYYLVAVAFLLFDVELLFLYPWAVSQWSYGNPPPSSVVAQAMPGQPAVQVTQATAGIPPEMRTVAFIGALVFILLVAAGFAYDWRKGVFEWR